VWGLRAGDFNWHGWEIFAAVPSCRVDEFIREPGAGARRQQRNMEDYQRLGQRRRAKPGQSNSDKAQGEFTTSNPQGIHIQ
jgi:hypothetical protein